MSFHWSELNKLGRSNQAWKLAEIMFDSRHDVDIQDWPGLKRAFFYLPTELHREPRPFGMKVSIEVPDNGAISQETLYSAILSFDFEHEDAP